MSVLNSCISHKTQVVSHQQVMKFELLVTITWQTSPILDCFIPKSTIY